MLALQVFGQRAARSVPADVCFSVVTERRTLDLQAVTAEQRDKWVEALKFAVKRARDESKRMQTARQRLQVRLCGRLGSIRCSQRALTLAGRCP